MHYPSPGDSMEISNHDGSFNHDCSFAKLHVAYFIAAGTGFTPMVRLIERGISEDTPWSVCFSYTMDRYILFQHGLKPGGKITRASGDFAPEMHKIALKNKKRAPENCHRL